LTPKGRLLGLDLGQRKIGIALSDVERMIASPHSTYLRQNMNKDLGTLKRIAKDMGVIGFVIGLPISIQGHETSNCETIRAFATKLSDRSELPILVQDERFSTAAATRALKETGIKRKNRDQVDDKMAAAFLLQGVLDSRSYSNS
jgi:putative Holliday junction resolvase